jgi:hypothetical protein
MDDRSRQARLRNRTAAASSFSGSSRGDQDEQRSRLVEPDVR